MKKRWMFATGLVFMSAVAFAGNQLGILGFDFVAPSVYGISNAPDQVGLIIYDSSTDSFYGKGAASAGIWQKITNDNAQLVPAGGIIPFGGTVAPAGYLLCDGSAVSRTIYAELFSVIGTNFGSGDGSTTFNLPDLRGRFLRGVDGLAGRDSDAGTRTEMNVGGNTGNQVGSVQLDAFKDHTHNVSINNANGSGPAKYSAPWEPSSSYSTYTTTGASGGGTETRPKNAYVNYLIKI
ncbi:MAG: tail fiber protein [Bdellovibrionaceae bacterium]|nr:tail fiber protein [Pseudobdellovibrionaceae bacterium]